ncbi:MAG: ATP-binding cassette domain-containing protein, partial [Clostridia bacterium]|nr:ATP-binding cassette domain-containing protein [Clostridia bacterium]
SYNGKKILDDVSISINEGDIYGLVGRNGAGKTTLIRILLGLIIPDSGEVKINDASDTNALERERHQIGSIIDSPALLMNMNAIDNLKAMALTIGKFEESELRELLHTVGLNVDDKLKVKNFSLGMKQRLAIAIALIGNPQILILDEPINGLDPAGIYEMRELLGRLNREKNITILISSHLLSELGKLATCYGVLQNGKLVKELRDSELEGLCRPYIKVVVGDLKAAIDVVTQNFLSHEFEIMPHNTLALYDLSKNIMQIAEMFQNANVPILNISQCEGDLESMFISLMGGLGNEQ